LADAQDAPGGGLNNRLRAFASALSPTSVRSAMARSGLAVLIGSLAATNILRIGNNLILTRLLAPEAFGIVGVITSISVILTLVTDLGFNVFIVRSPKWQDVRFLNVIWTIRLIRSAALTAVMFVGAGLFSTAFNKPELTAPIMATSFLFLLEGLRSLSPLTALRERRVSFISMFEFAVFIIQMVVTIAVALVIKSFWAIIIGMYAGGIAHAVLSYTLFPGYSHRIAFDREIGRELWAFARVVIVSSVITIIIGQADKIFIGRALSLDLLGLYMLAVNLTTSALQLVATYVHRVLLPEYSHAAEQSVATLRSIYYRARWRLTLALAFLLGGGIGGGHLIVRILFDERYLGAGVFVSLLCLAPLFSLVTKPAEQALISLGKVRSALEANVVRLAWIVIAAPLGYHFFGVVGMVAAFALIEAAAALYWWVRLRIAGLFDLNGELAPMALAVLGAAIGLAADKGVDWLIAQNFIPNF